jgi:hypothetical protein
LVLGRSFVLGRAHSHQPLQVRGISDGGYFVPETVPTTAVPKTAVPKTAGNREKLAEQAHELADA